MLDPPAQSHQANAPAVPKPNPEHLGAASVLYLPARPVRQVQPVLSYTVRRLIAAQVEVSVKVWISKSGTVMKAEALPNGNW